MKTIKLLLVFVFCLAVAVPAMAQKVAKTEKESSSDVKTKIPVETCENCHSNKIDLDGGFAQQKVVLPAVGQLNHFVYTVEANGSNMTAEVVNEDKGYAIVMQKFVDEQGEAQTVRFCSGNETYCKAIANGRECSLDVVPKDMCYLKKEVFEHPVVEEVALPRVADLKIEYAK